VLVIAMRLTPAHCAATVVSRKARHEGGALALYRRSEGWDIVAARPAGFDRPWSPTAADNDRGPSATRQPAAPDATPPEDLEAND
jgi:competence protein ComEC